MFRITAKERPDWQAQAQAHGFEFHTMYGEKYWDESAYYQFSLKQIEQDLEAPSEELHQMLLHVVELVCNDEALLQQFAIPQSQWELVTRSWRRRDLALYGRFDFSYDGKSPAKLLEANYDTPTSLFETGYWQWLWLQQQVDAGQLPRNADQFNSLQEALIERFYQLHKFHRGQPLHFACCKNSSEDLGTIQYMRSCAMAAGLKTREGFIEDIGLIEDQFVDLQSQPIHWMFKLYPWEFMFTDEYSHSLTASNTQWLEPAWKAILSNKAILPLLWQTFPNHPNLLPAYFEADKSKLQHHPSGYVKKPLFSREGANIDIYRHGQLLAQSSGDYGAEGYIYQAYHALPEFSDMRTLIGSWMVGDNAVGIGVREDSSLITQDLSRFLPHIILG
ncbi:glutathionylspermidine synthase family protein [Pseudoalteromonas 'SMAR']|uniref:glutathionylspermidine synthase family protein n=1 Tax=Pseudoalteromonas 'SMAR' TaxID=3416908 RepID=UPI003AF22E8F